MNDKLDKQLEKLVDKAMKHSKLESPSLDFTHSVMEQVNALNRNAVTTYQPLISKPVWIAIFVITFATVFYIIFGSTNFESAWLNSLDLSIITDNKLNNAFSGIKVSKTVMYAVVLFGLMIFIQIPILKNYFNKRIAI